MFAGVVLPAAGGGAPLLVRAGKREPPRLTLTHHIGSSTATFRTPDSWVISGSSGSNPEIVTADGGEVAVRFLRWDNEAGLDSLHVVCLDQRLAATETLDPSLSYEYEFLSGVRADRQILDSAYAIRYAAPVKGHTRWRHRVVTVVGKGEGLCVVAFCPVAVWKGSSEARATLESVVMSVSLP
jgi:hypothetical protein